MGSRVEDFFPVLKEAIEDARKDGLGRSADLLENQVFAVYTTSSELLGECGLAIERFLNDNPGVSDPIRQKLEYCLTEIRKVWP